MLVAPSDHVVPDAEAFHAAVAQGLAAVEDGDLVTFGIAPDRPETGYGYLELSAKPSGSGLPVKLSRFVEKPDAARAEEMLAAGTYMWNAGIFLFRARDIIAAFEAHSPSLLAPVQAALADALPDLGFLRLAPGPWSGAEDISIDYAVMERAPNLSVVPFTAAWSDLGGWDAVWRDSGPDAAGVVTSGGATAIDCEDTLLRSDSERLEVVGIGPCPFAAMMLADMGAEVIRVDRADGRAPNYPDPSADYLARGRRSLALDLKRDEGRQLLLRLVESSDVLLEGFRPGVMERLGLGPDICLPRNPRLVYGRVTGWGQCGPLAQAAGHDINYLGITGALSAIGSQTSGPVPPLNIVADFGAGGMMLTTGILAALLQAKATGRGQVVDAAMTDGVPLLMGTAFTLRANGRWNEGSYNNLVDGGAYFYSTYECADGRWIALGAIEPQFHTLLLEKLGLTDAPEFQNPMDSDNWGAAKSRLAAVFITHDQARIKSKHNSHLKQTFPPRRSENPEHFAIFRHGSSSYINTLIS